MLGGKGYYRGSTILVSGSAGTGKTSIVSLLARAACARGERCLFFAFEESTAQLMRNMRSVGIDLAPCEERGLLKVQTSRPTAYGLEMHLVAMHKAIKAFAPDVVILDPITDLVNVGTGPETHSMMTRLIDFLKMHGTTAIFTSLTAAGSQAETSAIGVSSLIDTWLMLETVHSGGERNRVLTIIKSRGMAHSNQATEYRLGRGGLELVDTYLGPSGVLTGSARLAKEAEDKAASRSLAEEIERMKEERERGRRLLEGKISALREEFAEADATLERSIEEQARRRDLLQAERETMGRSRHAFASRGSATRVARKGARP